MHMLQNRAMLVSMSVKSWTTSKIDRKVTAEIYLMKNAADDACRVSKALIGKAASVEIQKIISEARQFHYENTLPWDNAGWRILPSANFTTWSDKMRDLKQRFDAAVADFVRDYPSFVQDARVRLNGMYEPKDYPATATMGDRYGFETEAQPIPNGSHFVLDLGQAEIDKIAKSVDQRIKKATEAAMADLWTRLHEAVSHMADRLKSYNIDEKSGKVSGVFHDTLVGNIQDLCDLLPRLNVMNAPDLEAMRETIQAQLTAISPQTLRDQPETRADVAAAADAITDQMGAFMNPDAH